MTEVNQTAFPVEHAAPFHTGLTKRELFAAMAMQGMVANCYKEHSDQDIAQSSVLLADSLIEALNKLNK